MLPIVDESMNISAPENLEPGFLLACSAVVFLMQAGFCLLESGMVRSKNSINVAVKNVLDCAATMLLFIGFGFSMMFGASIGGLIGNPFTELDMSDPKIVSFLIFQLVFCSAAATIVSGAVAERVKLNSYLVMVLVVSGFVYPTFGHWAWGGALPGTEPGWLRELGFVDWAGGAVVHVVGGFCALAAAQAVGMRSNLSKSGLTGGYSLTLAILGTFLLWFGWWGFNGGSGLSIDGKLPRIILVTNVGAVTGGLTAAVYSRVTLGRIEVIPLITGVIAGLVSVTAACHVLSSSQAMLAGVVGAILALFSMKLLQKVGIDDAVGAFPVHGVAGVWSVVAFGLFAPESELLAGSRFDQIKVQAIGAIAAGALSYISVRSAMSFLKLFAPIRVTAEEEKAGLNVVEHGATNAVTDLVMQIDSHARTADFSQGIEADDHCEVGQIAAGYNRVIQRVQSEMANHEETNRWLEQERSRMQSILDHAGVGIYQLDNEGKIISTNATLLEMLGYKSLDQIGKAQEMISGRLLPWQKADDKQAELMRMQFDRGAAVKKIESEVLGPDGEALWGLESLVPVRDQNGNLYNWLGTLHDITEQKRASIAEIEIAKAKSDAKGEFLASMSHEIRTPLNGVIGMLDLLDASKLATKEKNFVSIAKNSAGSLLSLINDILDFSKIEAGHMELESIEFDVRDLVEQVAEQFAYHAHVKNLEMNCQISHDMPNALVGDPERLRQVIVNLLGNAIKFTTQGEINLCVARRGTVMRVSVQDTGIGMDEATQETLFQSFTQADASTTRKYGGTGLGLSISNKLVQLMGGRLRVNSEPSVGSEFWFEVEMDIVDSKTDPHDSRSRMQDLQNTRVLVIDDNSTNCEILANQFNNWGLNVSVCKESTRAIDKMTVAARIGQAFGLIILDYCMPEMNGRDVALAIQQQPELAKTPIILLSSNYELLSKHEMKSLGIFAAISKPARQSRLLDTVMEALHQQQGRSEPRDDVGADSIKQATATQQTISRRPEPAGTQSHPDTDNWTADVLIVEDNHVNRIVAEKILSEFGLTSDFACDGRAGVEKVQSGSYQMVLMDGHMPVLDGLAATREIRQWESAMPADHRRIPIVALTANVVQGVRKDCEEAGMDYYVCKPITMSAMRNVVEKFVTVKPKQSESIRETPKVLMPKESPVVESDVIPGQQLKPIRQIFETTEAPTLFSAPSTPSPPPTPTQKPEPTEELYRRIGDNLLAFEKLKDQFHGDEVFVRQILEVMHETLPGQVEALQVASTHKDFQQVAAIAHQIKGAAGDSCLVAVYETAAKLEQFATEEDASNVPLTVAALSRRSLATIELIETLIRSE